MDGAPGSEPLEEQPLPQAGPPPLPIPPEFTLKLQDMNTKALSEIQLRDATDEQLPQLIAVLTQQAHALQQNAHNAQTMYTGCVAMLAAMKFEESRRKAKPFQLVDPKGKRLEI